VFPFLSSSFITGNGNGNVLPFPASNRPTVICLCQVCIGPQFMARVFNVATTSTGTIIYSVSASLLSLFIAGTIIFSSLVMDNLKDGMGLWPDPPGTEDFVF
jgi:hypothetical protein